MGAQGSRLDSPAYQQERSNRRQSWEDRKDLRDWNLNKHPQPMLNQLSVLLAVTPASDTVLPEPLGKQLEWFVPQWETGPCFEMFSRSYFLFCHGHPSSSAPSPEEFYGVMPLSMSRALCAPCVWAMGWAPWAAEHPSAFPLFPSSINEWWPDRELWLGLFSWLTIASRGYLLLQFHSDQQKCGLFQGRKFCHNSSDFSAAISHLI